MDWCKVVDSFARFIADQFILLCQGLDRRIINNIRGRQYTLAPRVQFQITEFPCETGKRFTLQDADDSSLHNCNTFRITRTSALLHIHQSTTSLKGPTDVRKHESPQSCSAEKLRVLAVMWNQLDMLPPTQALLLAKQVHPDMAKTVPPASRRQRAQPQCKLPEERDKAQDVNLAPKSPPRSQSDWGSVGCTRTCQVHRGPTSDWTWICPTRWDMDKGPLEVLCCVVSCRVGHLGVGFESCGIWSRTSMDQAYSVWMCVWMVTLSNRIEKCNISSFSISIYLMLARPLGTRWDSVLGKAGQRHGHLLHSSSCSWAVCEERQGTLSCWAWNMINVIHFIC